MSHLVRFSKVTIEFVVVNFVYWWVNHQPTVAIKLQSHPFNEAFSLFSWIDKSINISVVNKFSTHYNNIIAMEFDAYYF